MEHAKSSPGQVYLCLKMVKITPAKGRIPQDGLVVTLLLLRKKFLG